jgi:hypothetical protein
VLPVLRGLWLFAVGGLDCPFTVQSFWAMFRIMKIIRRLLTRYWGYLALAVAIAGFFLHGLGPAIGLALALAALGYFLIVAPVWCGAEIRTGEHCRRNSHGLLRGCSLRQHKWQRVRQTFTPVGGRTVLAAGKSASGFLVLLGGVSAGVVTLIDAGRVALH